MGLGMAARHDRYMASAGQAAAAVYSVLPAAYPSCFHSFAVGDRGNKHGKAFCTSGKEMIGSLPALPSP